jgi:hypothetical protein
MGKKIVRTAVGLEEVGDFDDAQPAKKKKPAKKAKKKRHLAVVK